MKKISKIVSAFVCLAMAVGVGVAIGSTGRDAEGVKADSYEWEKLTSNTLAADDEVIFCHEDGNGTIDAELNAVATGNNGIVISNGTLTEACVLTVETGNGGTGFSFKNGSNYISWSSGNNMAASSTKNNASSWTVSASTDGNFKFANVGTTSRILQYNPNNGNPKWAPYGNNGQTAFQIYKKVSASPSEDPYITVDSTLSGFTGGHVDLAYTAGNLDSGLVVESGDASKVTVGTPTSTTADGTVQVNFLQPTTSAVKLSFKDGTTELAACNVSVAQTTLTLNTNAMSVSQGKTGTLVATHNASSLGGVSWSVSGNNKVSVNNGVVSVAADAVVSSTATITATSQVDSSVSASCTVTVVEPQLETTYDFRTRFSTYANKWTNSYVSHTLNGKSDVGGDYAATIIMPLSTKQTSTITTMPVVADQASGDVVCLSFELTETGYELGDVSVTFAQWNTNTPTMKLFKGAAASGTALDSGVIGTKNTISSSNVGGTKFVVAENDGVTSRKQVGIQSITITLKALPQLDSVTSSEWTTSFDYGDGFAYDGTLTAHYTQSKADATVTPSAFKYGASDIDPAEAGTTIEEGDTLTDATHNGKYIYIGYTEDTITKWTSGYQISVGAAPSYYMTLSISSDTGSTYGYKGGTVSVTVTSSSLAGNIQWDVTAGSTTSATSSNSGYSATIASVGTLTIKATDLGDSSNTQSVSITVVDSLKAVMAPATTKSASNLTFTEACGGSGTADDGATWTIESDANESVYEAARGIHYGTGSAPVQYVELVSNNVASGANKKIKSVVVNASDAQTSGMASLTVTVGGSKFHCSGEESVTLGSQNTYTFSGSATGEVVVRAERAEALVKAIYVKSVIVNYVTEGATSNIANAADMHLAQKAVIDYAKAFNDSLSAVCVAYGETDEGDLSDAWSALVTQYDNWFNKGGKSLSSDEIAHAKALFANADSVDREDDPTADELQHMLAKYDEILSHYDLADFLNTDEGTGRDAVNGLAARVEAFGFDSTTAISIIVIISIISVTSIGALLVLRRRKEN